MKAGWQTKKIHEVCELINGRAYNKSELLSEGKYRVLRVGNFFTNDHWYYSDLELEEKKYCDTGDLLYAWSASFGPRIWTGGKVIFHYHIWKVVPNPELIDQKFLFYFFMWDTDQIKEDQGTGTTMTHVSMGSMDDRDIQLPSLPEQQRIVRILDEAFACIATAKANVERNLQNARALFESYLEAVFSQRGQGWMRTTIGEQVTLQRGFDITKDQQNSGDVPVVSSGGIKSFHDTAKVRAPGVVIGRKGTLGKVFYLENDFWPHDTTLWVKEFNGNHPRFVYYFFRNLDVAHLDTGTANPALNRNLVHPIGVNWPTHFQQGTFANRLDALEEETQRLESIYQRKLAALDELKKSLLHQAFSGEL
jgi:type I restriction enzyme, S subunit